MDWAVWLAPSIETGVSGDEPRCVLVLVRNQD
jgi:hypothetical protein